MHFAPSRSGPVQLKWSGAHKEMRRLLRSCHKDIGANLPASLILTGSRHPMATKVYRMPSNPIARCPIEARVATYRSSTPLKGLIKSPTTHRAGYCSATAPNKDPLLNAQHDGNVSNKLRSLTRQIPVGSWDSHMHIIDPHLYSLSSEAAYRPNKHSLEDALSFESSVGINNVVLVQPSIFGFDNSCLLDALRQLGSHRARAVVAFDPARTPTSLLWQWHRLGVRGTRINLKSNGLDVSAKQFGQRLRQYADAIRPLDWVLQLYVPMSYMSLLESIVPTLGIRVCIDHLGHPDMSSCMTRDPYQIHGFQSLLNLLRHGNTFVKLSAPYRMSQSHDYLDLEPIARELIKTQGLSRVVFGTDWPHTRFEGLDIRPWIGTVFDWCDGEQVLIDRMFKGNAEELWGVKMERSAA